MRLRFARPDRFHRGAHGAAGRLRAGLARLGRDERGAAMMDYAFVGPMFLALVIAVIQLALVALAQQGLETAAEQAARLIMTGQAQNYQGTDAGGNAYTGMTQADFRSAVCTAIQQSPALITCNTSKLYVDVDMYNSYPAATMSQTVTCDSSGNPTNGYNYVPGTQGAVIVMRLMYLWPTAKWLFGFNLGSQQCTDSSGNTHDTKQHLIYATSILTTEGYTAAAS